MLAAACLLLIAERAEAVPTCPDLEVSTPYQTPVTITLQCQDPEYPVTLYTVLGNPPMNLPGNTTTYTPPAGFTGRQLALNYMGANSMGASDFGIVWVTIAPPPPPRHPPSQLNRPPIARCDSYSVKPGEVLRVKRPGVLSNDTDPDGDRLRVEDAYGERARFARPGIVYNGSLQFQPPGRRGMLSYRYIATDGLLRSESTVTFWVGMKDRGCRPPAEPPAPTKPRETATLLKTGGSVRIRRGGRWRSLGARYRLRRALLVDARRGSVRVRLVSKNNVERRVLSARFGGGLFKLGRDVKAENGKVFTFFNTVELAGGLGCPGPGRQLDVQVSGSGFLINALRLRVYGLALRNRRVLSRFSVSDRCNNTSVVELSRGRIQVNDHNTRKHKLLAGRGTYVARPRS